MMLDGCRGPLSVRLARGCAASLLGLCLFACETQAPPRSRRSAQVAEPAAQLGVRRRMLQHEGASFLSYELDLAHVRLTLVGQRGGEPYAFAALQPFLAARGRELVVATNAGIFDPERRPLGLHVQQGDLLHPLSRAEGEGNFFLKPNGVFWLDAQGAHVAASERYAGGAEVLLATQSGPLLVSEQQVHPAFSRSSSSLRVRSGVGVDARGRVLLALSLAPVTFFAMATLFRDLLACPNALYLDGEISGIASPLEGRPPAHEYASLLVATIGRPALGRR